MCEPQHHAHGQSKDNLEDRSDGVTGQSQRQKQWAKDSGLQQVYPFVFARPAKVYRTQGLCNRAVVSVDNPALAFKSARITLIVAAAPVLLPLRLVALLFRS